MGESERIMSLEGDSTAPTAAVMNNEYTVSYLMFGEGSISFMKPPISDQKPIWGATSLAYS